MKVLILTSRFAVTSPTNVSGALTVSSVGIIEVSDAETFAVAQLKNIPIHNIPITHCLIRFMMIPFADTPISKLTSS
jgi:hypothetical protein